MAGFAATLAAKATLRYDDRTVAEGLLHLTLEAFLRLVHEAGWPIESSRPGSLTCCNVSSLHDRPPTSQRTPSCNALWRQLDVVERLSRRSSAGPASL